ncbi:MAG: hypothetical protein KJ645_13365, partial [Planctomycetes bacterium]|nr:hypothetical protein [Planctomycetota bacterium]
MAILLLVIPLNGCGGGGSSKGGADTAGSNLGGDSSFYLEEVLFGRPIFKPNGELDRIISPSSLMETDPITGLILEGYPQPLFPGDTLDQLYTFNLGENTSSNYKVKVIPRNAAVVLDFTLAVDAKSLKLNGSKLTKSSPIALLNEQGLPVDVDVFLGGEILVGDENQELLGDDKIVLNPVSGNSIGFPASTLFFDQSGNPKAPEYGYLKLSICSGGTGPNPVLSKIGQKVLSARTDLFGSPLKPLGFNPGNVRMDFIDYGEASFNGFLPDLSAPRIIREVTDEGGITEVIDSFTIKDSTKSFVTAANNGNGSWAGGLFILRPNDPNHEERMRVEANSEDTIYLEHTSSGITGAIPPSVGDDYRLVRAEFFEPISGFGQGTTIDPATHPKDPNDQEDLRNSDLFNFTIWEQRSLDAEGEPIVDSDTGEWIWELAEVADGVPYDPGPAGLQPVNPNWRVSLRFSEPMSLDSFKPYETFFVTNATVDIEDPGFDYMLPGRATASDNNRKISFEPVVIDQYGESSRRHLGFGGKSKTLRLVLRVIPPAEQIEDFYQSLGPDSSKWPEDVEENLTDLGVLGIFDLGGQPLAMPEAFLDKGNPYSVLNPDSPSRSAFVPAMDIKYEFNTMQLSETDNPETGVLVHRFMGLPTTDYDDFPTIITGIKFNDHDNMIYGPNIADTSVGLNGYLSGRSVEFIQHIFDDYNTPAPSSPTYPDPIFKMPFGTGTPVNGSFGARFMHVYRKGDISPDVDIFEGTILDMIVLSWAPIGGWVTNTLIEKMSIGISYSNRAPSTIQHNGIPNTPNSGLLQVFDNNIASNPVPGMPDRIMVVGSEHDGVPYLIDWRNLYAPKNQGESTNYNDYIPWPDFTTRFPYDSSGALLIEYRMEPNMNAGVALGNGFAFHAGIMSSMLPRFRIYTRGDTQSIGPVHGVTRWEDYENARGPLSKPGFYGDNSRYLAAFDYVKGQSFIESPFLGGLTDEYHDLYFLNPIIEPPLSEIPDGTGLEVEFRSTPNPDSTASYSPWKHPGEVEAIFNAPP